MNNALIPDRPTMEYLMMGICEAVLPPLLKVG